MIAIQIKEPGDVSVLQRVEFPRPEPDRYQVLVRMQTAALNHLDLWIRNGLPGTRYPVIPGSDGAGIVAQVGGDVSGFAPGDEVCIQPVVYCGLCRWCRMGLQNYCQHFGILGETMNGTNCEYLLVEPKNLRLKPENLTLEEAAAFPLAAMTTYTMLEKRARIQAGESVLVWGASSGIGHLAVQLAKLRGCRVIATASTDEKAVRIKELGADEVVNYRTEDVARAVRDLVGSRGVDVVFEHVGAATWKTSLAVLGKGGRVVTCGATTGAEVSINLRHLFYKHQTIMGSTMGDMTGFDEVIDLMRAGRLKVHVDRVFPLSDIAAAHTWLEQGHHFGKVVLRLDEN